MRGIIITYDYSGDEGPWQAAIDAFIDALDADTGAHNFTYQVLIADDGVHRIHWGRWDNQETLAHVQSQDYFKAFAQKVGEFSGGAHKPVPANLSTKTRNC